MANGNETRILHLLKTHGAQETSAIASHLSMSAVGTRKLLNHLWTEDLIDFEDRRGRVGRPRRHWHLTAAAAARFPDTHEDLTIEIISAVRQVFGEDGLDRLIRAREADTLIRYRRECAGRTSLADRLNKLAAIRTREGYMAEVTQQQDGSWLLIENHCPICAAARTCQGLCRSELQVFQLVLGDMVTIRRAEHVLTGARRCAYIITPLTKTTP